MRDKHIIFGIHINDRVREVPDVQKIFTEFGCNIKTRIGLHHVDDKLCSPRGLILLEMFGDRSPGATNWPDKLSTIEGVEVQKMIFEHQD